MSLFSSTFRYALALAFGLGLVHLGGASARAEACGGGEASGFSSSMFFTGATPVAVGTIPDKTIEAGASYVRFSARFYFTETSGSALTYSAASSHPGIASVGDICGSMLKIHAAGAGTATITVTASANGGRAMQTVSVVVDSKAVFPSAPSNNAPVAKGTISDRTFTRATSPLRFVVSSYFTDSDGDDLTYAASALRTTVTRASVTDSTLTLAAASKDSTRVTVTATDPDGLAARQSFVATVANSSPVAKGTISNRTFTKATSPLRFAVSSYFSDPDPEDRLTYTVSSSRTTVAGASITGSTLRLAAAAKGTTRVTVTAKDPDGLAARQSFNVTIANSPPAAKGAISDRSLTLGSSPSLSFGVSSYFTDADGDALDYDAESSSSGVAPASIAGSTLTIRAVSAGSATVTVTAEDRAASVNQRFTVTVYAKPNQGPVVDNNIPDQDLTVGDAAATFNLNGYFSDPDDDDLGYGAGSSNSSVAAASVTGSTLSITPKAVGSAIITVTATDDPGDLSVSQTVAVDVKAKPAPPLQAAITGPTRIESGTSHTWRSTVAGGKPSYSYAWYVATRCTNLDHLRAEDEPCTLQWSSAGSGTSLTRTITTTSAYAHIRLVVSDSDSPSSSIEDTHSVQVDQPNNAPVANGTVAARTLTLGSSATRLNVSSWFTDKDDDRLTYTVASSPTGVVGTSIPSNSSTLTLSTVKAGTTTVTVTARDPSNASATQSFSVRVNRRPVASKAIPAQTVTMGGSSATVNLAEYFSDPDNDRLTWRVNRSNGRVTTGVSGNTLTISPVSSGTTTLTVIASDPYGASVSQSVTVNIATAAGLSASIDGPSRVSSEGRNTWTASVSGGRSPYVYRWRYRRRCVGDNLEADNAREVCTEWASGGSRSNFSLTLASGTTIELRVTDANNDSVTTTLAVSHSGL